MAICANPSLNKLQDCQVVAAIDIGTTFSGYAWSTTKWPKEIVINSNWGNEFGAQAFKTPTAILTDNNNEFVSFGLNAIREYTTRTNKCHLFDQNIKMQIYKEQNDDILVTSRDGCQEMPILIFMTMSIKFMFEHLIEAVKTSYEGFDESKVRVVLTVPAIWSESSKNFMKRAATKAGINSKNLILALEPEAASLYCRALKPTELQHNRQIVDVNIPNETRYMIIDCGGGTVDISVHEVIDDDYVREIYSANGGPWGGGNINEQFEIELQNLFEKTFIDNFKVDNPLDWYTLNTEFEFIKRTFPEEEDNTIRLPNSFINTFNTEEEDIGDYINNRRDDGWKFNEGRLLLHNKLIESMFLYSIQHIIDHIQNLWQNAEIKKVKYAFMVGGFSESGFLFEKVVKLFDVLDRNVHVIRPNLAGIAVLLGAVHFGHDPKAIASRISRMTIGAGVMTSYDDSIHDKDKKVTVDGEEKCNNIFSIWATKNESIGVGEKRTFTIFPHSKSSTSFRVTIYSIDKEEVTYTTEPDVSELATLSIPIPDKHLSKYNRPVKHFVYFGGTELHVRVQDVARSDGASEEVIISYPS